MTDWPLVPLAALAVYRNGFPFKPDDRGVEGLPIVRIEQFQNPNSRVDRHSGEGVPPSNLIETGDLIFSWSGTLAVGLWDRGPALLNQHLFRVDPLKGVDIRWLRWALTEAIERMKPLMHGSAMTHITRRVLEETRVPVPPLEVQRRIADYLDTETARIDTLIAKNERAARLVEERRRTEERGMFASAPRRVPLKYLLAARPSYGILKPNQVDEGVPVVRIVNVDDRGHISLDDCIHVPEEQSAEYRRTSLRKGDVVVSVVGTLGRSAVVDRSTAGANISRALARLQPVGVRAEVLAAWIRSTEFARLVDITTTGTAQRVLNMEDLVEFAAPVADCEAEFLDRLRSLQDQHNDVVDALARQRAHLLERRQALITAVITGEFQI